MAGGVWLPSVRPGIGTVRFGLPTGLYPLLIKILRAVCNDAASVGRTRLVLSCFGIKYPHPVRP